MTSDAVNDALLATAASPLIGMHAAAALWAMTANDKPNFAVPTVPQMLLNNPAGRAALGQAHTSGLITLPIRTLAKVAGESPQAVVDELAADNDYKNATDAWLTGRLTRAQKADLAARFGTRARFARAVLAHSDASEWAAQLTAKPVHLCPLGDVADRRLAGEAIVAHNPWWVRDAFDALTSGQAADDARAPTAQTTVRILAEWIAASDNTAEVFGDRGPRIAAGDLLQLGTRAVALAQSNPYLAGTAEPAWQTRHYPAGPEQLIADAHAGTVPLSEPGVWAVEAALRHAPGTIAERLRTNAEIEAAANQPLELAAQTYRDSDPQLHRSLLLAIGRDPWLPYRVYEPDGYDLNRDIDRPDAWKLVVVLAETWEGDGQSLAAAACNLAIC